MAPDFERLARRPCPEASLASSGTSAFNSSFERSCSSAACLVSRNTPANSAQALEPLMSTVRTASSRGPRGLDAEQVGRLAVFDAAPELPFRGEQEMLVQRI